MMEIAKANIVKSTAGRDREKLFFVLETEGEFLLLADGKLRPVETPKRKKRRHAQLLSRGDIPVAGKIRRSETITNSELRRALAVYRKEGNENQEG